MDNIQSFKKVMDLGWSVLHLRIKYIVDTYMYAAVDDNSGDIFLTDKDVDTLEDMIHLDYGSGPGAVQ